jgi:cytochrome c-type biogenesis protein CcmH/NrfG
MLPGSHKLDAKMLYADALAQRGDDQRARSFYISLMRSLPTGPTTYRAQLVRKISAVNLRLGLAESDGL